MILRNLERRWLESTNEFRVGDKYLCNQYYDIETMRRTLRISLRLFWLKILSRQHSEIISTFSRKLPKTNLEVNWPVKKLDFAHLTCHLQRSTWSVDRTGASQERPDVVYESLVISLESRLRTISVEQYFRGPNVRKTELGNG